MSIEESAVTPPRMTLVNMATNEVIEAQANPPEFEESVSVTYARHAIPGLSHQPIQFTHTENTKYKLSLEFMAANYGAAGLASMLEARKFLLSLCHPRQATSYRQAGAPRALFIWPNLISLSCFVTGLRFSYRRFNIEGYPVEFSADLDLEEVRDELVTSEQIRAQGTQRGSSQGLLMEYARYLK